MHIFYKNVTCSAPNDGEDVEQQESSLAHGWWDLTMAQPLRKIAWWFLTKRNILLPHNPEIVLLGI